MMKKTCSRRICIGTMHAFPFSVENYRKLNVDSTALFDFGLFLISLGNRVDCSNMDPAMTPAPLVDFHKTWCIMPLRSSRFYRQFCIRTQQPCEILRWVQY